MTRPTVIVPSATGRPHVARLLESLASQTVEHQVLLVDNASPPSLRQIVSAYPDVEILPMGRNAGFGAAVNHAAKAADGDTLVLVNDDCACAPDFVERLVAALDPGRGVVMAAGVLLDASDQTLIDSAGIELDETLLASDYLSGEPVRVLDLPVPDPAGPCGGAAAFDRDVFLGAGGFDTALFAYWEDVDLALRLRADGAGCGLARDARAVHWHSTTLGSGSARKNYLTGFGRGYTLRKWNRAHPTAIPSILLRDAPILAGQLLLDRNLAGVRGRVDGWRAAAGVAGRHRAPALRSPLARTMVRRARRRLRLRARRQVDTEDTTATTIRSLAGLRASNPHFALFGDKLDRSYVPNYLIGTDDLGPVHRGIAEAVADIPGWLRPEDCLKLFELAYHATGPVLEIGTYRGKSAVVIASALAAAGRDVTFVSLDIDGDALEDASKNLAARGLAGRVFLVNGTASAFLRSTSHFEPSIVFIDGDHSLRGVRRDLASLKAVVPPGGVLLFHDFLDDRNDDPAVREYDVVTAIARSWVSQDCDFGGVFGCTGLFRRRSNAAKGCVDDALPPIIDLSWRDPLGSQLRRRIARPAVRRMRVVLKRFR